MSMKRTPTYEGPLDAALRYLTPRMRSVGEVEAFLDGLDYGEADVEAAVSRLKELGLLDDFAYAREFVRTRLATKPVSRAHLMRQLREHRLSQEAMEAALEELPQQTDLDNAQKVAEKFYRQMISLPEKERRERVLRRLMSRGYSGEISCRAYALAAEALGDEETAPCEEALWEAEP